MDVHPTKNVSIGIDPYPYEFTAGASSNHGLLLQVHDLWHSLDLMISWKKTPNFKKRPVG